MIVISCPACKKKLSVKEDTAGKKMRCPACGQVTRCPPDVAATVGADERETLPPESAAAAQSTPLANLQTLEPDNEVTGAAEGTRTVPPAPPVLPGYEILAELGRGAMGVVFKARHLALNRLVALKMILGGDLAGADGLARFRTEAEAVAKLRHPNIVQIYETGEQGGAPFFSLEFVEGGTLAEKLHGTPMPPRQAAALAEILARAVHAAHEQGVIHRDLKPANILLERDGTPKIADFGLAKQLGAAAAQTASNAVIGTPSYMAPEQAAGKAREVGPAADVYALGAILYEMLTGRPPFQGASAIETLMHVIKEEPVLVRRLQPGVPRDLETICLKAMARDPRRRYATARELSDDLHRYLAGEPIRARPMGPLERLGRWCRKNPVTVGLLVAVTLGSAAGLWYLSRLSRELVEQTALDGASQQAEMLREAGQVYNSEVVRRIQPIGVKVTHEYEQHPGAAPIPTTFMIVLSDHYTKDNQGQGQSGVQVRLYSDYPFPSRKDRVLNEFETKALGVLREKAAVVTAQKRAQLQREGKQETPEVLEEALKDAKETYYTFDGPVLHYAEAIRMQSACVACHNTAKDSPKTDWKVGDVRGVLEITRPLHNDESRVRQGLLETFLLVGCVGVVLLGLTGVVLWVGRRRRSETPESPANGTPAADPPTTA